MTKTPPMPCLTDPARCAADRPAPPERRSYAAPRLDVHGDLRGLTFGGSPGFNDSGSEMTQMPPSGGP